MVRYSPLSWVSEFEGLAAGASEARPVAVTAEPLRSSMHRIDSPGLGPDKCRLRVTGPELVSVIRRDPIIELPTMKVVRFK
jgi:hypothetical protein